MKTLSQVKAGSLALALQSQIKGKKDVSRIL